MDDKMNSLKNRTKADMVFSFVVAVIAAGVAITEFWVYFSMDGSVEKYLTNGIYAIFIMGIALILAFMLLEVHKNGNPFSKRIINELRILAVFIIIGGILPDAISNLISNAVHGTSTLMNTEMILNAKNVIVSVIGVVIGIVSEIFVYGYELQDDMDSIA